MPNKHNDARRHHIPKMKFKVTNWSTYEAGLRRRGSLTLWVSDEAIAAWEQANASKLARARSALEEIGGSASLNLATLSVISRQLRGLAR